MSKAEQAAALAGARQYVQEQRAALAAARAERQEQEQEQSRRQQLAAETLPAEQAAALASRQEAARQRAGSDRAARQQAAARAEQEQEAWQEQAEPADCLPLLAAWLPVIQQEAGRAARGHRVDEQEAAALLLDKLAGWLSRQEPAGRHAFAASRARVRGLSRLMARSIAERMPSGRGAMPAMPTRQERLAAASLYLVADGSGSVRRVTEQEAEQHARGMRMSRADGSLYGRWSDDTGQGIPEHGQPRPAWNLPPGIPEQEAGSLAHEPWQDRLEGKAARLADVLLAAGWTYGSQEDREQAGQEDRERAIIWTAAEPGSLWHIDWQEAGRLAGDSRSRTAIMRSMRQAAGAARQQERSSQQQEQAARAGSMRQAAAARQQEAAAARQAAWQQSKAGRLALLAAAGRASRAAALLLAAADRQQEQSQAGPRLLAESWNARARAAWPVSRHECQQACARSHGSIFAAGVPIAAALAEQGGSMNAEQEAAASQGMPSFRGQLVRGLSEIQSHAILAEHEAARQEAGLLLYAIGGRIGAERMAWLMASQSAAEHAAASLSDPGSARMAASHAEDRASQQERMREAAIE